MSLEFKHFLQREAILAFKEIKTCSNDRFNFSNVSEGVLETIKVHRIPSKACKKGRLAGKLKKPEASQLSSDIKEKQMKALGEYSFLEKEHIEKVFPT